MGHYVISYEKRMEILGMLEKGISKSSISNQTGIDRTSITKIQKGGVQGAIKAKKAMEEDKHKEDEIVALLEQGVPHRKIIRMVGVTGTTIQKVKKERNVVAAKDKITEEQLKTWAYVHKKYGADNEKPTEEQLKQWAYINERYGTRKEVK